MSWIPSMCSLSYDIWYQSEDRSKDGNITVTAGMTKDVWLLGLDNCTDYSVRVISVIGSEFSDEISTTFNTCNLANLTYTDKIESFNVTLTDGSMLCNSDKPQCVKKTYASSAETNLQLNIDFILVGTWYIYFLLFQFQL